VPLLVAHADSVGGTLPPRARAALDTLRAWRFDARRWHVAPTLYRAWWATLLRQQGWSDVPGLAAAALAGRAPQAWHDPVSGAPRRPAPLVAAALDTALVRLAALLGPDLTQWRWERAHRARFAHALAARFPEFEPPLVAEDGDNATPSVGASNLPRTVEVHHGPVWRQVVDLAHPELAWGVVVPGNTAEGPHAHDLLARWAGHDYVPLAMDPARIAALAESRLTLMPRGTSPGRRSAR
jgi:penicillin amidase